MNLKTFDVRIRKEFAVALGVPCDKESVLVKVCLADEYEKLEKKFANKFEDKKQEPKNELY